MYYEQQYLKMTKWSKSLKATFSWQYHLYGQQIRRNSIIRIKCIKRLIFSSFYFYSVMRQEN